MVNKDSSTGTIYKWYNRHIKKKKKKKKKREEVPVV